MKEYKVCAVNPGSTSTKIAVFREKHVCIQRMFPMMHRSWQNMRQSVTSFCTEEI